MQILVDPLGVALDALAFGRAQVPVLRPRLQFAPHERVEIVAPILIGLRVEIDADDGKTGEFKCDQPVD